MCNLIQMLSLATATEVQGGRARRVRCKKSRLALRNATQQLMHTVSHLIRETLRQLPFSEDNGRTADA